MAKILVADDNSNIQKMVGLALKDQGIDVVAVGNGEAAVRKIVDVRPDLVLADVFMPVRNGYEVCRYVKADSSLAHIPVILLVGAFDPLDEQEAQRVGADGVLKKPFVPPDPLISMVKSALVRASAGQVAGLMEKAAPAAPAGPANGVPTVSAIPTQPAAPRPEPFIEDIPERPQSLKIDSTNTPLAFGKLLETSPATAEEDVSFVTPSTQLPDRNWQAPAEEEEEEDEEESSDDSWRRDGGNEAFAQELEKAGSHEEAAQRRKKRETWTPTREKKQDLIEAEENPVIVAPPPVKQPVAPPAPTVSAPVASLTPSAWMSAPPVSEQKKPEPQPVAQQPVAASIPASEIRPAKETPEPGAAGPWFSVTGSPWEAEAQKAGQLAATWDAPAAPAAGTSGVAPVTQSDGSVAAPLSAPQTDSSDGFEFVSEAPSEEPVFYSPDPALVGNEVVSHQTLPELISDGSISPETVETIRQETSYVLEDAVKLAQEMPAPATIKKAVEPQPQAPTATSDMDALVAKVLSKLSPEMLQAVTRELLKPIVETLVRDELKPNK